jgi:hypothetical protein
MYKKKKKGASIYSSGVSNTLFLTTAMGKKIQTQRTTHWQNHVGRRTRSYNGKLQIPNMEDFISR